MTSQVGLGLGGAWPGLASHRKDTWAGRYDRAETGDGGQVVSARTINNMAALGGVALVLLPPPYHHMSSSYHHNNGSLKTTT